MIPAASHIRKRIPICAGLAGGSADAAAVLNALNQLFATNFSKDELAALGEKIGADVPFCVRGGYARVTGIGEELTAFESPSKYHLVLVMPKQGKSTKAVFEAIDNASMLHHPDNEAVVSFLKKGKPDLAMKYAENVFQTSIPDEETTKLTELLKESGAYYAAMTGTGACVFGMFSKYNTAIKCRNVLRDQGYGSWTALPVSAGVERIIDK